MRSFMKAKVEVFPTEDQLIGRAKATAYFWRLYNLARRLSKCLILEMLLHSFQRGNLWSKKYGNACILHLNSSQQKEGYIQSPGKCFQTIECIDSLLLPGEWGWKKMRMLFGKNSQVILIFIPQEENHC